jgi:predicted DsbA family dithiol-disulfide isomerase
MAAADGITFTPWPHADHYPHWSLPALEAAKCAQRQGPQAFDRVHLRLYAAFFTESRNIADPAEVARIVTEAGVDAGRFLDDYRSGVGRDAVVTDYQAAIADRVRAIPAVLFPDTGQSLVGMVDIARYRAAIEDAAC